MTTEELDKEIEKLQRQLADLLLELKEEERIKLGKKEWLVFLQKLSNHILLPAVSFLLICFFIVAYFLWKLFGYEGFSAIFSDFSYNGGFFWVFIFFVVLCNVSYLKNIISSIVEENISGEILNQIRERAKKEIERAYSVSRGMKDEINKIN